MHLKQINITGIRNLKPIQINLDAGVNIFYGQNGSGKTSLLEAIHLLITGRSFRTRDLSNIVQFGQDEYTITGVLSANVEKTAEKIKIGTAAFIKGAKKFKIREQHCTSADIAKLLPSQFVNVTSTQLIEGGPAFRRSFMDWGGFHIEHSFWNEWNCYNRALLQRNVLIKQCDSVAQLKSKTFAWQTTFLEAGQVINDIRKAFLIDLSMYFSDIISNWGLNNKNFVFKYSQGWPEHLTLEESINDSLNTDLVKGVTSKGPHRADLEILVNSMPAKYVLSRGQLKLIALAMFLARNMVLENKQEAKSVFLIDDFNSELDVKSCKLFVSSLCKSPTQVFITGIEGKILKDSFYNKNSISMFHVEHGIVTPKEVFHVEHCDF